MTSAAPQLQEDHASEPALARALGRLFDAWSRPATAATDAIALVTIAAVCSTTVIAGAVHPRIYGHDIFVMLDAGWRVLNGQRPDVDFSPSMGPTLGLLFAAGLKLARHSVRAVGYASAIVGAIAALGGYWVARRRLAGVPALLAATSLALVATAPFPIGMLPNALSQAMVYNRYGYALCGLVALAAFLPAPSRWSAAAGGILAGAATTTLLFLKPSYGLVAAAFLACSVLLAEKRSARAAGALAGILFAAGAMLAYLRFDLHAIALDLSWMLAAKGSATTLWNIRWAFLKTAPDFLPLGALSLLIGAKRTGRAALQPAALALIAWTAGALLLATNGQSSGLPLDAVFAIILVRRGADSVKHQTAVPEILLALIVIVPLIAKSSAGLAYALADSARQPAESQAARINASHLSSLYFYDVDEGTDADRRSNGHIFANYVNDGMAILRRYSNGGETVAALDIQNPFSYALLRPPARGGAVALSYHHTFNDEHKPSFDWIFGSADVVMVPLHPSAAEPDAQALFRNYLADVRANFRLCAESDWWKLYKRPAKLAGCPSRP